MPLVCTALWNEDVSLIGKHLKCLEILLGAVSCHPVSVPKTPSSDRLGRGCLDLLGEDAHLTEQIEWKHPRITTVPRFLNCLLDRDMRTRLSAKKAMRQPWIVDGLLRIEKELSPVNQTNVVVLKFIEEVKEKGKATEGAVRMTGVRQYNRRGLHVMRMGLNYRVSSKHTRA